MRCRAAIALMRKLVASQVRAERVRMHQRLRRSEWLKVMKAVKIGQPHGRLL
jgi:hypothetical protein